MSEDVPVPEPAPPVFLFTLNDLLSEHDLLLKKEAEDRALVDTIEFPDTTNLKSKLIEWATAGFPDSFPIFSITVNPPGTCSDGVSRSLFDYVQFVSGVSIAEKMARLTAKLQGMYVLCSYSGNTITFHVFRGTQS